MLQVSNMLQLHLPVRRWRAEHKQQYRKCHTHDCRRGKAPGATHSGGMPGQGGAAPRTSDSLVRRGSSASSGTSGPVALTRWLVALYATLISRESKSMLQGMQEWGEVGCNPTAAQGKHGTPSTLHPAALVALASTQSSTPKPTTLRTC